MLKWLLKNCLQVNAVKLNPKSPLHGQVDGKALSIVITGRYFLFPLSGILSNRNCAILCLKNFPMQNSGRCGNGRDCLGCYGCRSVKTALYICATKTKGTWLGNQIEGFYEKGKKIVVIEDLVSTGKSSLQVVDVLKEAGLEITAWFPFSLMVFLLPPKCFRKAGITYYPLTDYPTLIQLAAEKRIISSDQQEILLKWRAILLSGKEFSNLP